MKVYTTEQLAEALSLKPQTIHQWRSKGQGPAWFSVSPGGPVRYREQDVEAWMEEKVGSRVAAQNPTDHSPVTSPCGE